MPAIKLNQIKRPNVRQFLSDKRSIENIEKAVPIGLEGLAINGKVKLVVNAEGNEKTMNSVYVVVWRYEDGVWRLLSHQTALQKPN